MATISDLSKGNFVRYNGEVMQIEELLHRTPGNRRECVYATYDKKGVLKCAIEQAYNDGKLDWKKPISCHLYPIRVTSKKNFEALNYHKWHICSPACALGKELQVPVYKFLKDPLIRKYGPGWYSDLVKTIEETPAKAKKS